MNLTTFISLIATFSNQNHDGFHCYPIHYSFTITITIKTKLDQGSNKWHNSHTSPSLRIFYTTYLDDFKQWHFSQLENLDCVVCVLVSSSSLLFVSCRRSFFGSVHLKTIWSWQEVLKKRNYRIESSIPGVTCERASLLVGTISTG